MDGQRCGRRFQTIVTRCTTFRERGRYTRERITFPPIDHITRWEWRNKSRTAESGRTKNVFHQAGINVRNVLNGLKALWWTTATLCHSPAVTGVSRWHAIFNVERSTSNSSKTYPKYWPFAYFCFQAWLQLRLHHSRQAGAVVVRWIKR